MVDEISHDEFIKLPTEKIREIVHNKGIPKVGVLIPDGTRRWGIINLNLNPDLETFEEELFKVENKQVIEKVKIFFNHGLDTLFMPGVTHGNFKRTGQYVDTVTNIGLKFIFNDQSWFDFYEKYDVKVKIYGDLKYVKKMGYDQVIKWIKNVEELTKNNSSYKIFHGLACSNSFESIRLVNMAIDFYKKNIRSPSKEELIKLYYGEKVDEVDFFLRPTVIRDSDIQPLLISGRKTQFYFPISPVLSFTKEMYREILYDMLFSRMITMSRKQWKRENLNRQQIEYLKKYYDLNKSSIIGIGKRIGNLWVPLPQVKLEEC